MKNITAALAAGKHVVDTSMGVFENPRLAPQGLIDQLESACAVHDKNFFSAGIDPGFGNDLFPMTLLGVCAQVNSIRTIEFIDAGTYPDQESLIQMGLKSTRDQQSILTMEGIMTSIWGGPLHMIADAVGVEVNTPLSIMTAGLALSLSDIRWARSRQVNVLLIRYSCRVLSMVSPKLLLIIFIACTLMRHLIGNDQPWIMCTLTG